MLKTVKNICAKSNRIAFVTGLGSIVECGGRDLWESDLFYSLEKKYKLCPEDMLSAAEFSSRKESFYDFYKKEVISYLPKPDISYEIIKKLEEEERLLDVLSFNIFGLEKLAGIENVVEIVGTVYDNYCPGCKKTYDVPFLLDAKGIPVCEKCKKALRPNLRLLGERVDNILYTQAAIACSKADTIIVMGADLSSSKIQFITGHYKGDNLILLTNTEKYGDKYADYTIYGKIAESMQEIFDDN